MTLLPRILIIDREILIALDIENIVTAFFQGNVEILIRTSFSSKDIADEHFDLVVCDLDGDTEVAEFWVDRAVGGQVVLMMTSAWDVTERDVAGFTVLRKPFDSPHFAEALSQALAKTGRSSLGSEWPRKNRC